MAKKDDQGFSKELPDQLLAGRNPRTVLDSGGLLGDLKLCEGHHISGNASSRVQIRGRSSATYCP
jgi:hypothetical protein